MHCFFKDVDVNLLESLKELYFLPYPHFPLPCCVLSSLHTMLANHVFWTAFMSHLLLLQKTEISQCCAAVWMYILYPFIASLVSPAQHSPYHTTQYEGPVPLHHPTEYQRYTYSSGLSPISKVILLSWLFIQQIALYPEIVITLQSSRVSCYLNEKCGRLL